GPRTAATATPSRHAALPISLTDIAGPAIRAERAAEAALLKVDSPRLSTLDRLLKRLFDVFGALVMLLLAAPIMLAVAIMIRGGTDRKSTRLNSSHVKISYAV